MVRGIANSKIGFGDLILLLRYFFKLKVSTHPKVSKNILAKHFPEGHSFNNTFERISQFMDKGNELRFEDHDFIALQVTKEIHQRRQEWAKINSGKNTNQRRVAYIVDSLKHEDEIKALRQIYTNGFFQPVLLLEGFL